MTEDQVHQDTDAKLPKSRAERPLPAEGNETIEEKRYAGFGCPPQIEDP